MWLYNISLLGVFPNIQNHDDLALVCREDQTGEYENILKKAMKNLNRQLKLNVQIACEIQVGDNLAETH
jgi:DNA polymerase I-like protein with 3'-5' exonuclease and polymerase domains